MGRQEPENILKTHDLHVTLLVYVIIINAKKKKEKENNKKPCTCKFMLIFISRYKKQKTQ